MMVAKTTTKTCEYVPILVRYSLQKPLPFRTSKPVEIVLDVRFFSTDAGNEPVLEWIREMAAPDRKTIGEDIKAVQIGWPLGMPLVRKMAKDLWEVRISLNRRIARILFTVIGSDMVLLHGFIKKSQATPQEDLDLAKDRMKQVKKAEKA
jgi:phage-related protein